MDLHNKHIVIATHNKGKISEISALVTPYGCTVETVGDRGVSEPIEDGLTFAENALIKSRHSANVTGDIVMADDSGLCVNSLDGRPGIHSARYVGENKDFNFAMNKLEAELENFDDKSAYFVCALAVVNPTTGQEQVFTGKVNGNLVFPMRGSKGFGFDPVFIPNGYDITFAEMNPNDKHAMSHRANAFKLMKEACFV